MAGTDTAHTAHVDSLGLLLRDLGHFPAPSHEEQVTLARRVAAGDHQARDRMISLNIRLVIHWARRYQHRGVDLPDLVQEGTFGLMRAVDKFDAERGYRFSTYASWWIRQALQRAVESQRTIRVPVEAAERAASLEAATSTLECRLGRAPSFEELADVLGTTAEAVRRVRRPPRIVVSLDQPADVDAEVTIGDLVGRSDEEGFEAVEDERAFEPIRHAVDDLPELEREVVRLRFGFTDGAPASQAETAKKLGIGVQRVRSAEHHAIATLMRADGVGGARGSDVA